MCPYGLFYAPIIHGMEIFDVYAGRRLILSTILGVYIGMQVILYLERKIAAHIVLKIYGYMYDYKKSYLYVVGDENRTPCIKWLISARVMYKWET